MRAFAIAWTLLLASVVSAQQSVPPNAQLISFPAPGGTLRGYFYVPQGPGPFPAVLWNHGSERLPGAQPDLAEFYTSHGFVFFLPHRSGQGKSPGRYIMDEIRGAHDNFVAVQLQLTANEDVVAALNWLRAQKEVDPNRIVVSGCSFGGIQTLLTAEKGLGVRAFVSFAPAAQSWSNGLLQNRLEQAVKNAKAPVFILQAKNDYSTGPAKVLGKIASAKGGRAEIYPAFGHSEQEGHWAFATSTAGIEIWQNDVLNFIHSGFETP